MRCGGQKINCRRGCKFVQAGIEFSGTKIIFLDLVSIELYEYIFFNLQTEKWGNVEWAHDLELHDTTARVAAAALFVHCKTNEHTIKVKN